jgi:hypothetical protein
LIMKQSKQTQVVTLRVDASVVHFAYFHKVGGVRGGAGRDRDLTFTRECTKS